MKTRAIGLCCLLACVACGSWQTVVSREGRFAIDMPVEPRQRSGVVQLGGSWTTQIVFSARAEGFTYEAAFFTAPREAGPVEDPDGFFEALTADMADKQDVFDNQPIALDGYPGREIRIRDGGQVRIIRMYLVNNRRYQLTVVAPAVREAFPNVGRFFDSFRLDP